jgi:hypothetical protein
MLCDDKYQGLRRARILGRPTPSIPILHLLALRYYHSKGLQLKMLQAVRCASVAWPCSVRAKPGPITRRGNANLLSITCTDKHQPGRPLPVVVLGLTQAARPVSLGRFFDILIARKRASSEGRVLSADQLVAY